MKTIRTGLAALLLSVSSFAFGAEPLAGAWELVSAKYSKPTGELIEEVNEQKMKSLKILSQNRFTFITQSKDGKFLSAGGGKYRIDGGKYIESVEYASEARMLGKDYGFSWQLANGDWIHKGLEDGVRIEEVWRRVK